MKKLFFHLLILSVILSSCANFVEDADSAEYRQTEGSEKLIKVCGELDFSGAVPAEIRDSLAAVQNDNASRSAIPSIPADAKYVVTANSAGKTPVTKEAVYNEESKKHVFELGLTEGTWNFTAELITADEKVLLTDTDSRILTLESPVVNLSFYLKPLAEGTGDISLTISYNNSEVEEIEYVPSAACKAEWDKGTNKSTAPSSGLENFIVEGLKAGSYDITILFKKDNALVYCTSQTINVLANMTTDSWVSGGGTGPIDVNGIFKVTADHTASFARSTFYVDGTNGSDITGSGGPYSPVKSLSKAVILADSSMEEGTKSIFVKAGGSETLSKTLNFSKDINVEVYTSAVGDRIGQYTVTRPETSESFIEQMVTINWGKTVTLSGIVIDGNKYQGAFNGMGIFVSGNLSLKNCVVRNCVTTGDGGGIYINGGTVTLDKNTLIGSDSENCATNSEYSNSASAGGGIYVANSGKLFNYGKVSFNYASKSDQYGGGGIYVSGSGYLECSGEICYNRAEYKGGGIYSGKEAVIDECKIFGNEAGYTGGGIWASGKLILKDSVIKNCSVPEGNKGNGIFLSDVGNSFKIKGSTYIDEESDIFISAGNVITIEENLTPKDENGIVQTTVAYLNISDAQADRNILSATTEALLKENIDKFEIKTPRWELAQGSGENSTKGQLKPVVYVYGGAESSGDGSIISPKKQLSAAFSSVKNQTSAIIYVAGTTSEGAATDIATGDTLTNLTVKQWPQDKWESSGHSGTVPSAVIGNGTMVTSNPLITIATGKTALFKDITIDGNSLEHSNMYGGGINNSGDLTLDNVIVKRFVVKSTTDAVYGGGIYNAGTLTVEDAVISGCKAISTGDTKISRGGGIYNKGTATIKKAIITGCEVQGNNSDRCNGAGIANYENGAILTLGDGVLDGGIPDVIIGIGTYNGVGYTTPNKGTNGKGIGVASGVFPSSGSTTLTLNKDCVIGKYNPGSAATSASCGNYSKGSSAGLNCNSGTNITIDGAHITYNYVENYAGNILGGITCFNRNCTASIKDLDISYNRANKSGEWNNLGLIMTTYGYKFENLKVHDNVWNAASTAKGHGMYVYENETVEFAGSTCFDTDADVYLNNGAKIKIGTVLTAEGTVATITPQYYNVNSSGNPVDPIQLLTESTAGLIAGNYSKFKVTPEASGEYVIPYCINSEGKLTGISQASLAELVSSFDSSKKYLITISDPNPDFTTLYNALKNSRAQFKLDLSQTTITTLASGSLHDMNKMIDVSFPSTLTTLEAGSIYSLSSSLTIEIPASVTNITGNPFVKATGAGLDNFNISGTSSRITLASSNTKYKMVDGVIYTADGKRLVCYPSSKTNTTFTIPAGVEIIGEGAFAGNSKLTEVTFNNELKKIENYAFARLTENKKVVLPASVTSIGDYSFFSNFKLETLTITGGNTYTIGSYAFSYFGLSSRGGKDCKVTIGAGVSEIDKGAFCMCYFDTSSEEPLVLPASLTRIGQFNFDRGKVRFIKSIAAAPPVVESYSLSNTGISVIYVPSSSVNAYENAEHWKDYTISGF